MQIVINIDKEKYDGIMYHDLELSEEYSIMIGAIRNGTVLPKGHGRLLDENEILKKDNIDEYADWCGEMHEAISLIAIHNAPTVLEADKEE